MDFVLCGGDRGGETHTFPTGVLGETLSLDVGNGRDAKYELREYEINGEMATQAIFIGYVRRT